MLSKRQGLTRSPAGRVPSAAWRVCPQHQENPRRLVPRPEVTSWETSCVWRSGPPGPRRRKGSGPSDQQKATCSEAPSWSRSAVSLKSQ